MMIVVVVQVPLKVMQMSVEMMMVQYAGEICAVEHVRFVKSLKEEEARRECSTINWLSLSSKRQINVRSSSGYNFFLSLACYYDAGRDSLKDSDDSDVINSSLHPTCSSPMKASSTQLQSYNSFHSQHQSCHESNLANHWENNNENTLNHSTIESDRWHNFCRLLSRQKLMGLRLPMAWIIFNEWVFYFWSDIRFNGLIISPHISRSFFATDYAKEVWLMQSLVLGQIENDRNVNAHEAGASFQ